MRRKLATLVFILAIGGRLAAGTESVAAHSVDSRGATVLAAGSEAQLNWQELQQVVLGGVVGGFIGGGIAGVGGLIVGMAAGAAGGTMVGFAAAIVGNLVTQFSAGTPAGEPTIEYPDRALD